MPQRQIRIGSRRSCLARAQAHALARRISDLTGTASDSFSFTTMTTTGDQLKDRPLAEFGGKGLFTRELDMAVLDDRIDIAVHSLKDLPCHPPADGLTIAAYLPRQDARDTLIAPVRRIEDLPHAARLGGASVRRTAQARAIRPDLRPTLIRGNLPTRLSRLETSDDADAMILAACGLRLLGLLNPKWSPLPVEIMPPAPGQGIVAAVTRCDMHHQLRRNMAAINDSNAHLSAEVERSFSLHLGGSCNVPLAAHCTVTDGSQTTVIGELLSEDGQNRYREHWNGETPSSAADARELGHRLALRIRSRMADKP